MAIKAELRKLHPVTPQRVEVERLVAMLRDGAVMIYPTDTLYGIGCAIDRPRSVQRIIALKGLRPEHAHFSFICSSISQVSEFALISDSTHRLLRNNLPGPFTFILPGLSRVPEYFITRRKTVGVRIPASPITQALVEELGVPILTTSLPQDHSEPAYGIYPDLMLERWGHLVDIVIDGGEGGTEGSTVVDCSQEGTLEVVRQGKGILKD